MLQDYQYNLLRTGVYESMHVKVQATSLHGKFSRRLDELQSRNEYANKNDIMRQIVDNSDIVCTTINSSNELFE